MADRLLSAAPERFDLAAHAMGGFVALEVLRRAPHRVRRLVLIATLAPADTPAQTARREGYLTLVEAGRFEAVVEERLPILLSPARRSDPQLIAAARAMAAQTGPAAFLRQQRAIMSRPDSRHSLAAIASPTLIIAGRQDGIVTLDHQLEMSGAIPSAELKMVDDCGHLAMLEQPKTINGLLIDFLDR
jgi:pimeloyl-ACP methyl ester carboxylesterase